VSPDRAHAFSPDARVERLGATRAEEMTLALAWNMIAAGALPAASPNALVLVG
jgi:hypothetical protein